jgi:poly(3-hydroxyoctanoate) depolymerase
MMDVQERSVRHGGVRLHVRDLGDGPPVLLINGLGAHTAMWAPLERVLTARFRVIEFDAPGTGQSSTPPYPVSIPALAWLAACVLNDADVSSADVLGYSMGGLVAQQLAVAAPARVRRLVLVGTGCGLGGVPGRLGALLNLATPLRYWSPAFYRRTVGDFAGGRARHDPKWVEQHGRLRQLHPPTTPGYLGQILTVSAWSGLPLLNRIHQPTLVVAGDDDPLVPPANTMLLARHMRNARALIAPGEGHLLLMDADSSVLGPIRDFLAAETLEQAPVWSKARVVDDDDLRQAIATTSRQAQPWGLASAAWRRFCSPPPTTPARRS